MSCQALANLFSDWLETGVTTALKKSNVPGALAEKIALMVNTELDIIRFCENIEQYLDAPKDPKKPKGRILDRAIVHMFELFYAAVLERSHSKRLARSVPEFFNIVPRGECLDLFLVMIKKQCIGKTEVITFTAKLEKLLSRYTDQGNVDWNSVYMSPEFVTLLYQLFTIIFSHMKPGQYPIPALNNGMDVKHNPERINRVLKHMLAEWQLQQQQVSIAE